MKKMKTIKIKYLKPITPIQKIQVGDWIDLRCAEAVSLKKGDFYMIPLGVCMELPKEYEAIVAPRSSLFRKYGLIQTNGIGIIDYTYNGDNDEWKLPVLATKDITIPFDERICQFRIQRNQPPIVFEAVATLGNKDRGGFGSTGGK